MMVAKWYRLMLMCNINSTMAMNVCVACFMGTIDSQKLIDMKSTINIMNI